MLRETITLALFDVRGYTLDEAQANVNVEMERLQREATGRLIALDLKQIPAGSSWHIRGVVQFQTTISEPDPEPDPGDVQEQMGRDALNKALGLASRIVMMREAGKRGEGLNYGEFWGTVDKLGLVFRDLGAIVGGPEVLDSDPPAEDEGVPV